MSSLAIGATLAWGQPSSPAEISAAIVQNPPPQSQVTTEQAPQSFAIEVMNAIAERTDLQVTYVTKQSWAEVIEALRSGEVDVIPNLGITETRAAEFSFSAPLETFQVVPFVRESSKLERFQDLDNLSIAVVRESAGLQLLQNQPLNLVIYDQAESALFALLSGEVDALVYAEPRLKAIARGMGLEDRLKTLEPPLQEIKQAIAVRPDNPALVNRLNQGVREFLASPEYRRLYLQWYGAEHSHWVYEWIISGLLVALILGLMVVSVWRLYIRRQIQAMRQIQAQLRDRETQYRTLVEASQDLIWSVNREGKITFINSACSEIYGQTPEALMGQSFLEFQPESIALQMQQFLKRVMAAESYQQLKISHKGRQGRMVWLQFRAVRIQDEAGSVLGVTGTAADVTQIQDLMRQSEQFFSESPDLNCIAGFDGMFKRVNPAWTLALGYETHELLGRPFIEFVQSQDHASTLAAAQALRQGERVKEFENRYRSKDGQIRWFLWNAIASVEDELIYATAHDITERKQLELERQQLNRYLERQVRKRTLELSQTNHKLRLEITERQQQTQELTQTQAFLEGIIEHLPMALFIKDASAERFGQLTLVNPACEGLFGLPREQLIGKSGWDLFPPEQARVYEQKDREAMAQGQIIDIPEEKILSHSLGPRSLHTLKVPIPGNTHHPPFLLCLAEDITERVQAVAALKKSEAKFSSLTNDVLEKSTVGMFILDASFRIVWMNQALETFFGLERRALIGKPKKDLIQTQLCHLFANPQRFQEKVLATYENNTYIENFECHVLAGDHRQERWLEHLSQPIESGLYAGGRIEYYSDITARKVASESIEQLGIAVENAMSGISKLDTEGNFVMVRQDYARLLGYEPEELVGRPWTQTVPQGDYALALATYRQMLETGRAEKELQALRKDGTRFYKQILLVKSVNADGAWDGHYCFMRDITDRKRTDERLRLLEAAIANASDAVLITAAEPIDETGPEIVYVNEAFCQATGYSLAEVKGKTPRILQGPRSDRATLNQLRQALEHWQPFRGELLNYRKDGSEYWVELNISPVANESNWYTHWVAIQRDISDRKRAEQEILETRNFLDNVINHLPVAVFVKDATPDRFGQFMLWNQTSETLFGLPASQTLGKTVHDLFPQPEADFFEQEDRTAVTSQQIVSVPVEAIESPHLGQRYLYTVKVPVFSDSGDPKYLLCFSEDITERRTAERVLRDSEATNRALLQAIPDLLLRIQADGTYKQVFSFMDSPSEPGIGGRGGKIQDVLPPEKVAERLFYIQRALTTRQLQVYEYQIELQGKVIEEEARIIAIGDQEVLMMIRDISDRKQAERQLRFAALHDELTGLLNRSAFFNRVDHCLKRLKRHEDHRFALLFIDLDRFKVVNDSLGHQVGDQLLIAIATILRNAVRETDTVARLGGDEFTVLVEEFQALEEVIQVVERLLDQLNLPIQLESHQLYTSASIGVVLGNPDYESSEDLIRDADIALYRAKDNGRSRYEIFNRAMYQAASRRLSLENDLRQAIQNQEFEVYYQPIICLRQGHIVGFEALVRWHHPQKGMISPGDFIPIAEETGLIVPLGYWVLRTACHQMKTWQSDYPQATTAQICVNLSPQQLRDPQIQEHIRLSLSETGLAPQCLELEITESMLIEYTDLAVDLIQSLRNQGIGFSLDDFGTGYSSLSYLHRFPVDTLKVDRSFVQRLQPNSENYEIIQAMIALAHTLSIEVVAEGIESPEHVELLQNLGCEFGQGFLFSRPVTADRAGELLGQYRLLRADGRDTVSSDNDPQR
ncbi:PAS domain S-box protein [Lyngbya confervoides]|uniref:PAS domain S-box protein n=1 Tax=Lyngbya confervoides BDU141951 TaxID=1574623 RepID=A0ABD4T2J0_9CYAN|nr:PAS domain S-box protein [Lyngbya confervoides]MCM1982869.1 PAS domain S-box protein [Lyngbya confervoides BDU141951]